MQEIKKILQRRGIKPTFQRIKILEYLQRCDSHPTVDMIFTMLYKKVPTLSKATVYNTLDIFRKHGLVSVLTISETELRYDYSEMHHHHFYCKKCFKIFNIDITCPVSKTMEVENHKVEEIHCYFKGICKDCLQKEINMAKSIIDE